MTMEQINLKAIKRRILAPTPPMDTLHHATLINVTLLPIYNHVFMSLVDKTYTDSLDKEVLTFL